MKDIILINPQPVVLKNLFAENIMYANPPMGLGYLASALRKKNFKVDILDMGAQRLTVNDVYNRINDEEVKIVGISSFIANHGNGIRLATAIKEKFPNVKIIMGGPQASSIPNEILETGVIDVISMFEGEVTIPELVDAIINNKPLKNILGIAFKEGEKVIINKPRPLIEELDTIDFPAWDLFELDKYSEPGVILTGRGCPFKCIFCSASVISGARYRMRSVKNVVDEIELLYKKYNIKKFFFADDTFTANREHCAEICKEIRRRKIDIRWEAEARANTVNDYVAAEMSKSGCTHVQIGAESGDNTILKTIGKNVTTNTIEKAVKTFLKHGITVVCSFILGNPDDNMETCNKTIDFAVKIKKLAPGFATCKFSLLTPLPGTPVYEKREELGIKLLSKNWDKYTFIDPICENRNLNKKQLQNLYTNAWIKYVKER